MKRLLPTKTISLVCKLQAKSFLFCFLMLVLNAGISKAYTIQQDQEPITITGTVTDANGFPLPGVSVMEKNTNNGTTTDFDGNLNLLNTEKPPEPVKKIVLDTELNGTRF